MRARLTGPEVDNIPSDGPASYTVTSNAAIQAMPDGVLAIYDETTNSLLGFCSTGTTCSFSLEPSEAGDFLVALRRDLRPGDQPAVPAAAQHYLGRIQRAAHQGLLRVAAGGYGELGQIRSSRSSERASSPAASGSQESIATCSDRRASRLPMCGTACVASLAPAHQGLAQRRLPGEQAEQLHVVELAAAVAWAGGVAVEHLEHADALSVRDQRGTCP